MSLTLHTYWRSGAAWRVRIALGLKGLAYTAIPHDLRRDAHKEAAYLALNRQGLIPALEADGELFTQSPAILEWLEECYPTPALLPKGTSARARVRAMAAMIACDVHPLNNLRVLQSLRHDLGASEAQISAWIARWITASFGALEEMIAEDGGLCAFGDSPTIADCCLIPQVGSARRFGVDLAAFPRILAVDAHCATLPAFCASLPETQSDAD